MAGRLRLKSLPIESDIVIDMRTISLAVSEKNYELFRLRAREENRSIASLIRDAMADYLRHEGQQEGSVRSVEDTSGALLPGPGRYRIYAEVSEAD